MPLFPCSCKENEAVQGVGAFSGGSQLWNYTTKLQPVLHTELLWTGPLLPETSAGLMKSTAATQGNCVCFKTGDPVWLNVDLDCWIRMNCRNELLGILLSVFCITPCSWCADITHSRHCFHSWCGNNAWKKCLFGLYHSLECQQILFDTII